jgi:predicted NAD/FAD-dependent oxidoreductase
MSYLSLTISQILYCHLHRWRYAYGDSNTSSPWLLWDEHQHCGACGDWCYQGTVESAFLVANQFIKTLSKCEQKPLDSFIAI